MKEFDALEQLCLDIVGEFQSISTSEGRLREALRAESTRAEAAEAALEAAERAASEARNTAAAAAASAAQAATALSQAQEELTGLKMQVDLVERQRALLEERCVDMSHRTSSLERELHQLRPLQPAQAVLHRQYAELQGQIRVATEHARKCVADGQRALLDERCIDMSLRTNLLERKLQQLRPLQPAQAALQCQYEQNCRDKSVYESSRLEAELRRVERCASSGSQLRERARLAAAAHARERKLAAGDLQHATKELLAANSEIARLGALVAELQLRVTRPAVSKVKEDDSESFAELRACLEAERAGSARLEHALAAALTDNAALATSLHAADNAASSLQPTPDPASTNIGAIDSFLAE